MWVNTFEGCGSFRRPGDKSIGGIVGIPVSAWTVFHGSPVCLSVCLSRAGGWLTGWSTRWDVICNEDVWAGHRRAKLLLQSLAFTGLGKQFFWIKLSCRFGQRRAEMSSGDNSMPLWCCNVKKGRDMSGTRKCFSKAPFSAYVVRESSQRSTWQRFSFL